MEKHWLKQYDNDVPHSLQPYPERTLLDVVRDAALSSGRTTRLCCSRVRLCRMASWSG